MTQPTDMRRERALRLREALPPAYTAWIGRAYLATAGTLGAVV